MSRCPRVFEVEALRDGRLSGDERGRFERHLSSCRDCSAEALALETLRDRLRDEPHGSVDELQLRRERTRLLSAFDHSLVTRREASSRRWVWGLATCAVLSLVGLMLWFGSRNTAAERAASSNVIIHAEDDSSWSHETESTRQIVVLEQGGLWIHVAPEADGLPLLVRLPDGELEDTGTVFSVQVEDKRTVRVEVEEGSVVLRLSGRAPIALGAGNEWTESSMAAATSTSSRTSAQAPPPAAAESSVTRESKVVERVASASTESLTVTKPDASREFGIAMGALNSGNPQRAAALFHAFLAQFPTDTRREDAAYLRVLAHHRAGNAEGMRAAASYYLNHYPSGFRRAEVQALLP